MGKLKKKMLDIGPGQDQVGLNITEDTPERYLLATKGSQTITGAKTIQAPAMSNAYPSGGSDVVPKKAFADKLRCVGHQITNVITLRAEDIENKYITLSNPIAPGQAASLEIILFEGAPALALNQDFGVIEESDGSIQKLTWEGYNLDRPGVMVEGQNMAISYNICLPTLYDNSLDINKLYLVKVEGADDWQERPFKITAEDSGKELKFMKLKTGKVTSITLPEITGSYNATLSCHNGVPILYTVPTLGTVIQDSIYYHKLSYPFLEPDKGAFRVYVYNVAMQAWVKRIDHDITDDLTKYSDKALFASKCLAEFGATPIFMNVIPLPEGDIGLYFSFAPFDAPYYKTDKVGSMYLNPSLGKAVAILKVFDANYMYKDTYEFISKDALGIPGAYTDIPRLVSIEGEKYLVPSTTMTSVTSSDLIWDKPI